MRNRRSGFFSLNKKESDRQRKKKKKIRHNPRGALTLGGIGLRQKTIFSLRENTEEAARGMV